MVEGIAEISRWSQNNVSSSLGNFATLSRKSLPYSLPIEKIKNLLSNGVVAMLEAVFRSHGNVAFRVMARKENTHHELLNCYGSFTKNIFHKFQISRSKVRKIGNQEIMGFIIFLAQNITPYIGPK